MTASLLKLNRMREAGNKKYIPNFRPKTPQEATIRDKSTEVRTMSKLILVILKV